VQFNTQDFLCGNLYKKLIVREWVVGNLEYDYPVFHFSHNQASLWNVKKVISNTYNTMRYVTLYIMCRNARPLSLLFVWVRFVVELPVEGVSLSELLSAQRYLTSHGCFKWGTVQSLDWNERQDVQWVFSFYACSKITNE